MIRNTSILLAILLATTGCSTVNRIRDRYSVRVQPRPEAPQSAVPGAEHVTPTPDNPLGLPPNTHWVHGRNIQHWPENFRLHNVILHPAANDIHHHITLDYSGLQDIPAWHVPGDPNNIHNVNGNVWVIRKFDDQWYIGTFEYLRVGQTTKEMGASRAWMLTPQTGDRIGFMVSTLARHPKEDGTIANGITYQGRSNIHWTTWP